MQSERPKNPFLGVADSSPPAQNDKDSGNQRQEGEVLKHG